MSSRIEATVEKNDHVSLRRAALAARTSSIRRLVLLAAMLSCISGCSLGLAQPKVTAGKWFPEAELARIQRGASSADVQRIAGAPLETTKTPEGERWRYSMTVERKEHVKLLGVIPMPSRRSVRTFEVVFLIRDGLVADVTSRDSGPR
jgi:outer membrane protein assembly factor BamE (lipoprotein component of BamABCDE complex)